MQQRSRWQSILIWVGFIIILPIPLLWLLNQHMVDTAAHIQAADEGLLAYSWWLGATILASRPRWLVSRLNIKTVYQVHGVLGVFALLAATIHRQTEFSFQPAIKLTGNIAWWLTIIGAILAIIFLSGWLTDRWPGLARFKNWLSHHGLRHQLIMWLHRLNLICIALIWLHVNFIPQVSSVRPFMLVFDIYTIVTILIYVGSKVLPFSRRQQAVVHSNQQLNDSTRLFVIDLQQAQTVHVGATFFLRFPGIHGLREPHPFSLISAKQQDGKQELKFIIRQNGDDTKRLDQVETGARVRVEGPFGDLDQTAQQAIQQGHPLVLYGMGTGIAPLIGISQKFAGHGTIHVLWSYSREADHFLNVDNQFQDLTDNKDFQYSPLQGRMNPKRWQEQLSDSEIENGEFIIIGGSAAILQVETQLQRIGVKGRQLHDERLTM
ncbi:FAD-binding oxidoreductase [Limosilactobacillus sp.]|uniref:FAD-binding oxidoreductase n=1 Tax=Limosilactobacillus sp. TaxID=2773925 RepID=UPI00345E72C1